MVLLLVLLLVAQVDVVLGVRVREGRMVVVVVGWVVAWVVVIVTRWDIPGGETREPLNG
jgi:hypothetical protein